MKTKTVVTITITSIIILLALFLIIKSLPFTGYLIYSSEDVTQKLALGYCPTMYKEALSLAKENNLELIEFPSAFEVLLALNQGEIDQGLIGRKAEQTEINSNIKEKVLKSGYTLVSNEKGFIDSSRLFLIEIYTYLNEEIVLDLVPDSKVNYLESKEEIFNKISQGKITLISWDDWKDEFELIVVMGGTDKDKNFRGVFLYSYKDSAFNN